MAGFDYVKSRATADRLIKRFGQTGTLIRMIPGSGPKSNPGPSTSVSFPMTIVVLSYDRREINNTNILSTDKHIFASTLGNTFGEIEPSTDTIAASDGNIYTIVPPVSQLNPGGVNVLWDLQARL